MSQKVRFAFALFFFLTFVEFLFPDSSPFIKYVYFFSNYYVPDTMPDGWNINVNRKIVVLSPRRFILHTHRRREHVREVE